MEAEHPCTRRRTVRGIEAPIKWKPFVQTASRGVEEALLWLLQRIHQGGGGRAKLVDFFGHRNVRRVRTVPVNLVAMKLPVARALNPW
jgi:hypothetical protein